MEFCSRCGESRGDDHICDRALRAGSPFDPERFCVECGTKLTVQVLPHGVEARCLRCERRSRREAA